MNQVAEQTRPENRVIQFKRNLKALMDRGELALPSTVRPEAFRNAAIVAVQSTPEILDCNTASVMKAIRTLAGSGLVPDGREAAIAPFKGQAQAMPMVFGLVKVARNTGKVTSLWAEVVYEGEALEVFMEDGDRKWNHIQDDGSRIDPMSRGGKIRGAYAVAKLSDGTVEFQAMSREEIEKRRKISANQKGPEPTGIWAQWYEEMAKKTVIRALCKLLPMSTEDIGRIMKEQDAPELRDVTPEPQEYKTLSQRLQEEQEAPKAVEGEILDPKKHWTDEVDTSDAFPGDDVFTEGAKAFNAGEDRTSCPHSDHTVACQWLGGWDEAKKAAEA